MNTWKFLVTLASLLLLGLAPFGATAQTMPLVPTGKPESSIDLASADFHSTGTALSSQFLSALDLSIPLGRPPFLKPRWMTTLRFGLMANLSVLPDKWVDLLSQGGTLPTASSSAGTSSLASRFNWQSSVSTVQSPVRLQTSFICTMPSSIFTKELPGRWRWHQVKSMLKSCAKTQR